MLYTIQQTHLSRSWRLARNYRIQKLRWLSDLVAEEGANDGIQSPRGLLSWDDYHAKEVGRRSASAENVNATDLPATLEAHRAYNRASVIRLVDLPPEHSNTHNPVLRPVQQSTCADGSQPIRTSSDRFHLLRVNAISDVDKLLEKNPQSENMNGRAPIQSEGASRSKKAVVRALQRKTHSNPWVHHLDVKNSSRISIEPTFPWIVRLGLAEKWRKPWLLYTEQNISDQSRRSVFTE